MPRGASLCRGYQRSPGCLRVELAGLGIADAKTILLGIALVGSSKILFEICNLVPAPSAISLE